MSRIKMNPIVASLLDLHDRGIIVLPESVIAARSRYEAANQLPIPEMPSGNDLATNIVASLHSGEPLDIPKAAADLVQRREVASMISRGISDACGQLAESADNTMLGSSSTIITESLRPAFDAVVAELKAGVEAEDNYQGDALLAPRDVREKLARRAELVQTYTEISIAAERLARLTQGQAQHDTAGYYARLRNPDQFKPGPNAAPRIPNGIIERLRGGGVPWLPTIAEQDDAFIEGSPRYKANRDAREAELQRQASMRQMALDAQADQEAANKRALRQLSSAGLVEGPGRPLVDG